MQRLQLVIRGYQAAMRSSHDRSGLRRNIALSERLRRARARLGCLLAAIRTQHPDFMAIDLELPGILALIPAGGALVAPLVTSRGSAVFVLPHGARQVLDEHVVRLPAFTEEQLFEFLRGPADDPAWGGWMGAYYAFRRDTGDKAALEIWQKTISSSTRTLWDALIGPVHQRLSQLQLAAGARVIVLPHGGLGLLPLHAAWCEVHGSTRAFGDDYTVSYAPSAYVLATSQRRMHEQPRQQSTLFAVSSDDRLPGVPLQISAVAGCFPPAARVILDDTAAGAPEAVLRAAAGRAYIHFTGHASYDLQDVMRSRLALPGGHSLALSAVMAGLDLSAARLVVLAACETGMTEVRRSPDEYIGLPAGFLYAGVPAVVSSLWAVDDQATMFLIGRFYANHTSGMAPPMALREAQVWLRNATAHDLAAWLNRLRGQIDRNAPIYKTVSDMWRLYLSMDAKARRFAEPIYWAAFTLNGA